MKKNHTKHHRMANAVRFLSINAIENASSGHPGLPMGAADIVTVLFTHFLKFEPKVPDWPDRDRFILSAGHGSILLYSLLYLTGYEDITLDALRNFRQLGSKTPGHPEYDVSSGIETTTGPLGQGLANAVGFALCERIMNASFGDDLVHHRTWALVGDGCLMEGISQEAISLAGHLKLNNLIVIWDNNSISIDGPISLCDSTDQIKRFSSVGWNTFVCDGHDPDSIQEAMEKACQSDRPSFIAAKTIIGFGCGDLAGTNKVHGSPLGKEHIEAVGHALGWEFPPFYIPPDILDAWRLVALDSSKMYHEWEKRFSASSFSIQNEFKRRVQGELPLGLNKIITDCKKHFCQYTISVSTRKSSEMVLEYVNNFLPETIGGSADLTSSNNTKTSQMEALSASDYGKRYIHYGVREHAMVAIMNGLSLHGGVIPYGGTFLCFSDYARPAIRLACLMKIRCIFVMTHDSIALGEDGPTHQPVEHLASLRCIPNHYVFRPADSVEVAECWEIALESKKTPSTMALTRQNLPILRNHYIEENLCRFGAYEMISSTSDAKITIFSSGSEVEIAVQAQKKLEENGYPTRLVSVPCFELFWKQDIAYQEGVIGNSPVRIGVEAALRQGWDRLIGTDGIFVGMSDFGASGSMQDLYQYFGITAEKIFCLAKEAFDSKI